jgi:hypothetical protein
VNYCSGTVSEKSDEPKKDQDNGDEIKKIAHIVLFFSLLIKGDEP